MQIRKTYKEISPTLLYDEIKDFVKRQGIKIEKDKLETYSIPTDSSNFVYRGTLSFTIQDKEAFYARIIGIERGETKLIVDYDENMFPIDKIKDLKDELEFILGPFEKKEI